MKTALLVASVTFALASGSALAEGCAYGHSAKMAQDTTSPADKMPAKSASSDPKLLAMLKQKEAARESAAVVHN